MNLQPLQMNLPLLLKILLLLLMNPLRLLKILLPLQKNPPLLQMNLQLLLMSPLRLQKNPLLLLNFQPL